MTSAWERLGLVVEPSLLEQSGLHTHASNPLLVPVGGSESRLYFSTRDSRNRSSVAFLDFGCVNWKVRSHYANVVCKHGPAGSFWRDGIGVGSSFTVGERAYIDFMGWQSGGLSHWRGDIGRMEVDANGSLHVSPQYPTLTVNDHDAISVSYPFSLRLGSGKYRMWYGSTRSWCLENGEMLHTINYADSSDGLNWEPRGLAVPYSIGEFQAFARPSIIQLSSKQFHMWFSVRTAGTRYTIAHSQSDDGLTWSLPDLEFGLGIGDDPWEDEMVCYPHVFVQGDDVFMLYNGNSFGLTGVGLARLVRKIS